MRELIIQTIKDLGWQDRYAPCFTKEDREVHDYTKYEQLLRNLDDEDLLDRYRRIVIADQMLD